jgi:hypothetical protein
MTGRPDLQHWSLQRPWTLRPRAETAAAIDAMCQHLPFALTNPFRYRLYGCDAHHEMSLMVGHPEPLGTMH